MPARPTTPLCNAHESFALRRRALGLLAAGASLGALSGFSSLAFAAPSSSPKPLPPLDPNQFMHKVNQRLIILAPEGRMKDDVLEKFTALSNIQIIWLEVPHGLSMLDMHQRVIAQGQLVDMVLAPHHGASVWNPLIRPIPLDVGGVGIYESLIALGETWDHPHEAQPVKHAVWDGLRHDADAYKGEYTSGRAASLGFASLRPEHTSARVVLTAGAEKPKVHAPLRFLPFAWGFWGVAYNQRVKVPDTSYRNWLQSQLRRASSFEGMLLMTSRYLELSGLMPKYARQQAFRDPHLFESWSERVIQFAKTLPNISNTLWLNDASEGLNALREDAADIALISHETYLSLLSEGYPIHFGLALEGSLSWSDGFCLMAASTNSEQAIKFLRYLYDPGYNGLLFNQLESISSVQSVGVYQRRLLKAFRSSALDNKRMGALQWIHAPEAWHSSALAKAMSRAKWFTT